MINIPIGIRTKILLVSSFLFTIPWLGYQYVWEMEKFLRIGQEQALVGTARAVATALHNRPALFNQKASFLSTVEVGKDLYAHTLNNAIYLDGNPSDWSKFYEHAIHYDKHYLLEGEATYKSESLFFKSIFGKYRKYLYAFFEVTDDHTIFRSSRTLAVDRNDHLQIALLNNDNQFKRYIISPSKSGWVNAFEVSATDKSNIPLKVESQIQGHWLKTANGYNIEMRIPLVMTNNKIGFAIADVDDQKKPTIKHIIGTSDTKQSIGLGTVLVPSPEIEKIIGGLGRTTSRIWVVDKHQRVLSKAGNIKHISQQKNYTLNTTAKYPLLQQLYEKYILPVYYMILTRPHENFIDDLSNAAKLEGEQILSALDGKPISQWRLTSDKKAVILAAAHPIWIDDKVMGAIIVEETTNNIRTLRNTALEKLFNIIIAILTFGTLSLFILATRISYRIKNLRDNAELAIDAAGRIHKPFTGSNEKDEIGDLSRSFANILHRLGQYNQYLENMSKRLSHEIRTPIAVVRSSLENLAAHDIPTAAIVYMQRAQQGLDRLSHILTNMSEATHLEQTLESCEKEDFNLYDLMLGCVETYRSTYPNFIFELNADEQSLPFHGAPELFAQLIDKLINNAMEFSHSSNHIYIKLRKHDQLATIKIINEGPYLPDNMQDKLFESMISVRKSSANNTPHLGLGLYIARLICEFHHGSIQANNREDMEGVVITIEVPLND